MISSKRKEIITDLNKFIANANDSINKQPKYFNAQTGKRYHPGDELNINPFTKAQWKAVYLIITVASCIGFIVMFKGG